MNYKKKSKWVIVLMLLASGCIALIINISANRTADNNEPPIINNADDNKITSSSSNKPSFNEKQIRAPEINNEFQAFIEKWNLSALITDSIEMTMENKEQFIKYFQQFDDITFKYIILLLQGIIADTVTNDYDDHEYGVYLSYYQFYLYDMNGDGVPELILKSGTCEADYRYTVYTIVNSELIECGNLSGSHAALYTDGLGSFVRYAGHMGCYDITLSVLEGTKLITQEIASGEVDYSKNKDYPELKMYGYENYNQHVEFKGISTLMLAPKG